MMAHTHCVHHDSGNIFISQSSQKFCGFIHIFRYSHRWSSAEVVFRGGTRIKKQNRIISVTEQRVMSAVLKASFWENDQKTELRRFQIDFLDGDCSYNLLRKKLQSYHEDKVITSVSWTDEDGDEIIVDNDEDVKVVVQNCSADTAGSGVVKLNVHLSTRGRGAA